MQNDPQNVRDRTKANWLNLGLAFSSCFQVSVRGWKVIYKRNHINEIKNGTVHKIEMKTKEENPLTTQPQNMAWQGELGHRTGGSSSSSSRRGKTKLKSTSPHSLNKLNLLSLPLVYKRGRSKGEERLPKNKRRKQNKIKRKGWGERKGKEREESARERAVCGQGLRAGPSSFEGCKRCKTVPQEFPLFDS